MDNGKQNQKKIFLSVFFLRSILNNSMMLVLLLLVVVSCTAAPWKPGIPTKWNEVPSKITDFPYDAATKMYIVDVWNYTQRLGAYKTMLQDSQALHFDKAGFKSPLWGLPLQFGWQHDTGRLLGDAPNAGTLAGNIINTSSWWGGMNFMLSAIPFLGALEAGVLQVPPGTTVQLAPPRNGNIHFPTTYEEAKLFAPNATINWFAFFQAVQHPHNLTLNQSVVNLWKAHVQSLHEGIPIMKDIIGFLPSKTESEFGLSWANLVDFIAALRFDVDYNKTNYLQGMIVPPRMLTNQDKAPHISDFTHAQNRALVVSKLFNEANILLKGGLLTMFKKACCTQKGRDDAYSSMIALLTGKTLLTIEDMIKFVVDLLKAHPC